MVTSSDHVTAGSLDRPADNESDWPARYARVRRDTERLVEPLSVEDCVVQTIPDVSPPKWHLAHTTWFYETFLLVPFSRHYRLFHPDFARLFNSYYEQVGEYHPRPRRGWLSRPAFDEVLAYRHHVDTAMQDLLADEAHPDAARIRTLLDVGLNHEQQHQELLLTDTKHILGHNPLHPAYRALPTPNGKAAPLHWLAFDGGLAEIGAENTGFHYDNEAPRHRVWLEAFELASRPVTNGEYLAFIEDGGYRRPELWLSDGWQAVKQGRLTRPLYWQHIDGEWHEMTLGGLRPLDPDAPVCHVSYFEADAYAHWAGARLPTEAEWERAAQDQPISGNLRDAGWLHPAPADDGEGLQQLYGDVWEWTASAYAPYPGFRPPAGALGEYNGKFMCGQYVLRGGSCVTPADHIRASYRNFFYPPDQWQFSGIRLARDPS